MRDASSALIVCVRWRTSRSRVRKSIPCACCASDDFLAFGDEYTTLGVFLEQAGEEYGTSYETYRIPPFAAAQALLFRTRAGSHR